MLKRDENKDVETFFTSLVWRGWRSVAGRERRRRRLGGGGHVGEPVKEPGGVELELMSAQLVGEVADRQTVGRRSGDAERDHRVDDEKQNDQQELGGARGQETHSTNRRRHCVLFSHSRLCFLHATFSSVCRIGVSVAIDVQNIGNQ